MYRVELKEKFHQVLDFQRFEFLMYRVELKAEEELAKLWEEVKKFLMYRVELKAYFAWKRYKINLCS